MSAKANQYLVIKALNETWQRRGKPVGVMLRSDKDCQIRFELVHFKGIATCYDKLKQSYENSVALACIFIWLPLSNVNSP